MSDSREEEILDVLDEVEAQIVGDLEDVNEYKRENARLRSALKDQTRATADVLQRTDQWMAKRAGGDWKELALVLGGGMVGYGVGYYGQKFFQIKVPLLSIGGAVIGVGGFGIRQNWSVRASMIVGGAAMATGAVVYAMNAPEEMAQ